MADHVDIPQQSLIVVADGHQAILFRSNGVKDSLTLSEEKRLTPKNLADEGPSGNRPEEQTERQTDEATFAKQLAQSLYALKQSQKFEHLVLVADPQTLGQMRDAMHKSVSESIVLTLNKALTNHSSNDIAEIVRKEAG